MKDFFSAQLKCAANGISVQNVNVLPEKIQKCDHRIGNTFTFCTDIPFAAHFNCAEKKSFIYVKTHMTFVGFFWLPFCLKHISYFHNILWLGTDAATSFLPLYLLLSPSRNYLFCNHRPPRGVGFG
jgi:hypothetical protein